MSAESTKVGRPATGVKPFSCSAKTDLSFARGPNIPSLSIRSAMKVTDLPNHGRKSTTKKNGFEVFNIRSNSCLLAGARQIWGPNLYHHKHHSCDAGDDYRPDGSA